ncbi:MAG: hypothetical protein NTW16_09040, partial [Bacteroidetes bacterium]|nr:hypothetical protein [Bacteroidota bacterium]
MNSLNKEHVANTGKFRQTMRYLLLGVVVLIMLTFIFRSPMAAWYIQLRINRFNQTNQATLKISNVRILGLASILVTGINLKPHKGDTLLKVDSA